MSPSGPPRGGTVYVLAPVHNRREHTERFARCLAEQTDQGFHLVLVDDGSTDGTAEAVRAILPATSVIRGKGDWWWAGSLDQARRWLVDQPSSPGDIVVIANDDTTFGPDFIETGRRLLPPEGKALLLAQPFSRTTGESLGIGVRIRWRRLSFKPATTPDEIDCFSTRGLFIRRDDFIDLGRFHTVLLPHYLSDYEFTIRARRRGFRFITDPRLSLLADDQATGIRSHDFASVPAYLRSTLTIRATKNPIYWTTFVLLASPRRHLVRNLIRVWRRFVGGLIDAFRERSTARS